MKINVTQHYYRSYKKYQKKHYPMNSVDNCVKAIISHDSEFLKKHKDHSVGVNREMHVDRHYNDNWLLYYRFNKKVRELTLILVALGTHDDLNRIAKN